MKMSEPTDAAQGKTKPEVTGQFTAKSPVKQPRNVSDSTVFVETTKVATPTKKRFKPIDLKQDLAGKKIGAYQVEEVLGEGGFSVVYKVLDVHLGVHRALKLFKTNFLSPTAKEDFERLKKEARIATFFRHRNICKVYSFDFFGDANPIPYIVMDFIEGVSLRSILSSHKGRLSEMAALAVFLQCLEALSYAFETGVSFIDNDQGRQARNEYNYITHRDVKPENVLVNPHGCYLIDFGIAKTYQATNTALTMEGVFVGTPPYMSPEALDGQIWPRKESFKNDLYSLCVILYEMCEGRAPFRGSSLSALTLAVSSQKYEKPSCHPKVANIIRKGLARKYNSYDQAKADAHDVMTSFYTGPVDRIITAFAQAWEQGLPVQQAMGQLLLETSKVNTIRFAVPSRKKLLPFGIGIGVVVLASVLVPILFSQGKPSISKHSDPTRAVQKTATPSLNPAPKSTTRPKLVPGQSPDIRPTRTASKASAAKALPVAKKTVRPVVKAPVSRIRKPDKTTVSSSEPRFKAKHKLYAHIKEEVANQNYSKALRLLKKLDDPAADYQRVLIHMQKREFIKAIMASEAIRSDSRLESFSIQATAMYQAALCYSNLYFETKQTKYKTEALNRFLKLKVSYKGKLPTRLYNRIDSRIRKVKSF